MKIAILCLQVPGAEQVADGWGRLTDRADAAVKMLPVLGVALLVIVVFGMLASLVRRWDWLFRLFSRNQLLRSVIRNIVSTAVLLLGIIFALEILDATKFVGAVLGAAGVIGLAVGFAFKDLVENYLASILLAIRRPFNVRDLVDIDGHLGKVMSLTTRATILMTLDGNHIRLPNAKVFKAVILNFTRNPRRRFSFNIGAGTGEDLIAAQRLGLSTLTQMEGVMEDPEPFSVVDNLGDSTVSIEFRGWVDQEHHDFERVRGEAIRRIKVAFDSANIEMPEPTYRVLMTSQEAVARPSPPKPVSEDDGFHVGANRSIDRQIDLEDQSDQGGNLLEDD